MSHALPSADHLADFTAHFKRAQFNRNGSVDLMFALGPDQLQSLIDLQRNDGMALNVTVWGTELGDGEDDGGLAGLIDLLGLSDDDEDLDD